MAQAVFDAYLENPHSCSNLECRSIGTLVNVAAPNKPPSSRRSDLDDFDEASFLHLIVDVLICFQELLRNPERVLEAFPSSCAREGRGPLFKRAFNSWNGYRAVLGNGKPRSQKWKQ